MATSTMMDEQLTLTPLLRHGARLHSHREVVTWQGDHARRVTFADTYERIARLASALRELGVGRGDVVATFCWNHQEHLEVYFAVPCMGAVLHTLNIRLSAEQLDYVIRDGGARVVIVDDSLVGLLAQVPEALADVDHVIVVGDGDASALDREVLRYDRLLADRQPDVEWPDLDEREPAMMCHTTGTTGNPKGVVYSHRSQWTHTFGTALALQAVGVVEGARSLVIVPQFHANAWGMIYVCWMAGSDILQPERHLHPDPLTDFIAAERPTYAAAVPTVFNGVLAAGQHKELDLSSLRKVGVGGSAVPRALIDAFRERYGVEVYQGWGMTELSPMGALSVPPPEVTDPDEHVAYRAKTGRMMPGVELRLVTEDGREQPWDGKSQGEIEVRGPWATAGYHRLEDTGMLHDGWLRTGDIGVIDPQGFVQIIDRTKDVIKSGGEWISSVELETTIAAHSQVLEAAVIGVPDQRWDERPLAVVVATDGDVPTPAELSDFLQERVPRWWVPERWTFIDEIPKTSVGKHDKKALRARHQHGELDIARGTR